jgi:hypothetical protein
MTFTQKVLCALLHTYSYIPVELTKRGHGSLLQKIQKQPEKNTHFILREIEGALTLGRRDSDSLLRLLSTR